MSDGLSRRGFARGLIGLASLAAGAAVCRPAIVRAASLDLAPVRHLKEATQADVQAVLMDYYRTDAVATQEVQETLRRADLGQLRKGQPDVQRLTEDAFNQKTGLWESQVPASAIVQRPELLTESMPTGEWMKRREGFFGREIETSNRYRLRRPLPPKDPSS